MNIFRIHIRPDGGLSDSAFSFAYCLDEQVLGVGWQTYTEKVISNWQDYEAEAGAEHGLGELSRVRYLKNYVKKDDLIWTRCPSGHYFLAKVDSEWEYYTNDRAKDADIVNVVRCRILRVPSIDDVPGKIVACFRPPRTIQAIDDEAVASYSKYLWNLLSKTADYQLPIDELGNVFSFLTSEQTEDLIFVYLQLQGWIVIPHSRKADTMSYEFYLIHRETRERAVVQVKTGNTPIDADEWKDRGSKVFLFQANGLYSGDGDASVLCISPKVIMEFMNREAHLLPSNIARWSKISGAALQIA
jgi:hypothetical protein